LVERLVSRLRQNERENESPRALYFEEQEDSNVLRQASTTSSEFD